MKYCADCRTRSRAFPYSITLENGDKLSGKICKICDRKFLMLDQYRRQMMPMTNRDEDLRHQIEGYEMKFQKAEYLTAEEERLKEDLCVKENEYKLEKKRIMTAAELHADSIKRGEQLLRDIDRDTQQRMQEMQKDRI